MDWQATIADWLDTDWIAWQLLPAIGAAALALISWQLDRRRMRRSDPDAVGWLPWRDIAFWASFLALLLFGATTKALLLG